jgi:hypothetical protein
MKNALQTQRQLQNLEQPKRQTHLPAGVRGAKSLRSFVSDEAPRKRSSTLTRILCGARRQQRVITASRSTQLTSSS